jgi:hypothetical protein
MGEDKTNGKTANWETIRRDQNQICTLLQFQGPGNIFPTGLVFLHIGGCYMLHFISPFKSQYFLLVISVLLQNCLWGVQETIK